MDFSWTKEQTELRTQVAEFAERELNDDLTSREQEALFLRDLWKKCAEFGIQALPNPGRYGGRFEEANILTSILAMEGFGYGCRDNGLAFALNAQMWTVQLPIARFGTDRQKERLLPAFASGDIIGSHALTEPEAGSDAFSLKMTAEKCDGGYVLNGRKSMVSLAPVADVALVFASTDPALGKWGVSAFLVDTDKKGVTVGEPRSKMGLRTVPLGDLEFDECFVEEKDRLGAEGSGFSISSHSLEYERCAILASQLGAMERQLEETVSHARRRQQFGQPIGKFQSVSNRVAEMKLRLETSRLLLYRVAWLKQAGKPAMLDAALLKLHLSESFVSSSLDTIRNHGGRGYLTESEIERDLRDAVGGLLYAGTSDIQRNIIARILGL